MTFLISPQSTCLRLETPDYPVVTCVQNHYCMITLFGRCEPLFTNPRFVMAGWRVSIQVIQFESLPGSLAAIYSFWTD